MLDCYCLNVFVHVSSFVNHVHDTQLGGGSNFYMYFILYSHYKCLGYIPRPQEFYCTPDYEIPLSEPVYELDVWRYDLGKHTGLDRVALAPGTMIKFMFHFK